MSSKSSRNTYKRINNVASHGGDTAYHAGTAPVQPTYSYVTFVDTVDGGELSKWRDIIRKGENATTTLNGVRYEYEHTPFIALSLVNVYGNPTQEPGHTWVWNYHSHGVPLPTALGDPSAGDISEADNGAKTNLYKQYEKQLTLFNGGTFLGELAETVRMIANPAKTLRLKLDDYLATLKKGRRGTPKQKREFLADTWLEFSFGWAPLLGDIEDAAHYLSRREKQLSRKFFYFKGGSQKKGGSSFTSNTFGTTALKSRSLVRTRTSASVRYKGAVKAEVLRTEKLSALSASGFAPRNWLPTVWELVPWSFAIDYFSNIGDVITAYSNGSIDFAWGYKTQELLTESESTVVTYTVDPGSTYYFYSKSVQTGRTKSVKRSVSRSKVLYIDYPSVQFELPGFGKKWLNLAALQRKGSFKLPF